MDDRNPALDAASLPKTDAARPEAPPLQPAGFWRRYGAMLIDGMIPSVVIFVVFFLVLLVAGYEAASPLLTRSDGSIGTFLGLQVAWWLYFALAESSATGATLGKKAAGIRVSGLEGQRISFARATGRYFAKILSAIPLMIGFLMAGFRADKRALHDLVAGTRVVVYRRSYVVRIFLLTFLVFAVIVGGGGAYLALVKLPQLMKTAMGTLESPPPDSEAKPALEEPEGPGVPAEPVEPVEPGQPEEPAEPVEPGQPEEPSAGAAMEVKPDQTEQDLALAEPPAGAETPSSPSSVDELLDQADKLFVQKRLVSPAGENAYETYQKVLALDAANLFARQGITRIQREYVRLARAAASQGKFKEALAHVVRGESIRGGDRSAAQELRELREEIKKASH